VSRRVADIAEAAALMQRLRAAPPASLVGFAATITDVTDALIFTGGDEQTSIRVVVRPSGTEPKLKCYLEIHCAPADDLSHARLRADALRVQLLAAVGKLLS
jgi:phosphomannomutase